VISRAKYGDAEAIHTIGCMYASKKKNKEKAILCLGTSSAMGFYQSQTRLGDVFAKDNYAAASNWYRRAQNNGVKDAYLRMGELLFSKGNFTEAEVEFKKAAGFGDPCSQNRLGEYYKEIKCRPNVGTIQPIYSLAMQWFRKAADQNYSKAQYNIGRLYECGGGDVFSDYYQSIEWYQKYKDGGFEDADTAIERLNKQGYFYIPQSK
jgi:TPR repeat protein